MKRFALLVALMLFVAAHPAYSQKRELPDMPAKRFIFKEGEAFADSFLSEGATIRVIRNNGLTVAAVCYDYRSYLACEVSVLNGTDKRVDVIPENFFLAGQFANGKADYVYSLSPTKLAKKIEGRVKWGNFFRVFAAGMATATSTSTVTGDLNARITTTSPNVAAQRNAAIANQQAADSARQKADIVISDALLANTVFPKRYVSGMVYFERKKFETAFFSMIIDGTAYSFGFNRPK
jgi:hypothetical protein